MQMLLPALDLSSSQRLLNAVLRKYYQKRGLVKEKKQLNEWMFFLDW